MAVPYSLRNPSRLPFLVALALAWSLAGCASTGAGRSSAVAEPTGEEAGDTAHAMELHGAELALKIARLKRDQDVHDAEAAVRAAEFKVYEARRALALFREETREHRLEESRIDLADARGRVEDAGAELEELEAMYAEEEFAGKTKELVLTRGRRRLELARRRYILAESAHARLEGVKLPEEERELQEAVESSAASLASAVEGLEIAKLEGELGVHEAEMEREELEEEG